MSWQSILAQGFTSSEQLLDYLQLPRTLAEQKAHALFPARVPRGFAARMQKGDGNDPLLRQVLASADELNNSKEYSTDPLQEAQYNPLPGLIHKYENRVLLTVTGACAINCRYCFRRHFPYEDNNPGRRGWDDVGQYLQSRPEVNEVILSGGDPLLANDRVLGHLFAMIEKLEQIKTLRIHSRIPVVLPERLDEGFQKLLEPLKLNKVLVIHSNHPQEIEATVKRALQPLRAQGVHLLNQSVLLKGINDDVETLVKLSERLFDSGVLPYYLHVLDKVAGAAHFDLPMARVMNLYAQLQTRLAGYLLPRLVREVPGKAHKSLLFSENNCNSLA